MIYIILKVNIYIMVVCMKCGLSIDMYLWDTSIFKLTWILTKRLENLSIPFFETTPIFFPFFFHALWHYYAIWLILWVIMNCKNIHFSFCTTCNEIYLHQHPENTEFTSPNQPFVIYPEGLSYQQGSRTI
jgi:hypothetical protein